MIRLDAIVERLKAGRVDGSTAGSDASVSPATATATVVTALPLTAVGFNAPRHFDSMVHSDASQLNASPTAISMSMPGSHSNRRLAASVGRMALGLLRLLVSRCEAKDVDW